MGGWSRCPRRELAAQRRAVGMVFQHFNMFGHKTAPENVIEAPRQVKGVGRDGDVADRVVFMTTASSSSRARRPGAQLAHARTHPAVPRAPAMTLPVARADSFALIAEPDNQLQLSPLLSADDCGGDDQCSSRT